MNTILVLDICTLTGEEKRLCKNCKDPCMLSVSIKVMNSVPCLPGPSKLPGGTSRADYSGMSGR